MRYVWAVYNKTDYEHSIELFDTEEKANQRRDKHAKDAYNAGYGDDWKVEQLDLR